MSRHRALLFGQPLAPWQATRELAEQSAIEADAASRDPGSGRIYLSPGVSLESDDGTAPMTPDMERWAEALQLIKMFGRRTELHVAEQLRILSHDPAGRTRWQAIGKRIKMLREAAARDARH